MINLKNVYDALIFAQAHGFKKPQLRLRREAYNQLFTEFKATYSPANFVISPCLYRNVEIYGMRVYIVDEQIADAIITEGAREICIVVVNEKTASEYLEFLPPDGCWTKADFESSEMKDA